MFVIVWGDVFVIVLGLCLLLCGVVLLCRYCVCYCVGVVFVTVWGMCLLLCGGMFVLVWGLCLSLSFLFCCSNLIT